MTRLGALAKEEARRLCEEGLALDKEILHVSLVDMSGDILGASGREAPREKQERYGMLTTMVQSIFSQAQDVFGEMRYVESVYRNRRLLIIPALRRGLMVVVTISPEATSLPIFEKFERSPLLAPM